jgi:hypothetical protein
MIFMGSDAEGYGSRGAARVAELSARPPHAAPATLSSMSDLRPALLELHRLLLAAQRVEAERFGGRLTSAELLQAAADDLRFSWLKQLSELIAALDQARADGDEAAQADAVARARQLLAPPDPDTAFGARYLRALQDHPEVVLAHRDVTAALG